MRRSTFPQHVTKHRRRVTKHCMRVAKLPLLAGKLPMRGSIVRQHAGSFPTRGYKLPAHVTRLEVRSRRFPKGVRTLVLPRSTFPEHVTKHRMRVTNVPLLAGKLPMSGSSTQGLTDREGKRHGTGGRHTTNPGPATDCHISRNGNSELELPLIVLP
jgi:hypothetical protein